MKRLLTFGLAILMLAGFSAATLAVSDTQNITCRVDKLRSIITPSSVILTVNKGSKTTAYPEALKYEADYGGNEIVVSASVSSGTALNARLKVQGGNINSWRSLISGSKPAETNPTLVTTTWQGQLITVDDIMFQLDATGVSKEGRPWAYQVTYTIQAGGPVKLTNYGYF